MLCTLPVDNLAKYMVLKSLAHLLDLKVVLGIRCEENNIELLECLTVMTKQKQTFMNAHVRSQITPSGTVGFKSE